MDNDIIYKQLLDDIKKSIENEFNYYNSSISEDESISSILLYYANWRRRFIGQNIRKIIYSQEIKKNCKYIKYKKVIDKIEYKLKNAEDITSFLSKGVVINPYIYNSNSQNSDKDTFLNAFNIHHLHLGKGYKEKDKLFDINFIERTEDLLFVLVLNDKVYFLDILGHDFYNEGLFRIIKNNWSQIIEPYKMSGFLPSNNSMEQKDKKKLLNAGVNMMIELDNEVYALCELVTSGHNYTDVRNIDLFIEEIRTLSEILVENQVNIIGSIQNIINRKIDRFEYKIKIEKGLVYFFENNSKIILRYSSEDNQFYISNGLSNQDSYSYSFNK
ncbi:MAG: hypothetical protein ABFR02_10790 [Campylobacterota bacterium]